MLKKLLLVKTNKKSLYIGDDAYDLSLVNKRVTFNTSRHGVLIYNVKYFINKSEGFS